jgi:hypothetical protein
VTSDDREAAIGRVKAANEVVRSPAARVHHEHASRGRHARNLWQSRGLVKRPAGPAPSTRSALRDGAG